MEEYNPKLITQHLFAYWWLVLLVALAGGVCGLIVSLAHAPIYEARAVFFVSIDLTRIPNPLQPLEQMDEDMALASTQGALLNPAVLKDVLDEASKQDIIISRTSLIKDSIIERRGTFWDLRYHNTNPDTAQIVVNIWAARGYKAMVEQQNSGQIAGYVIFHPPDLAEVPRTPVNYARSRLILAGGVIGIILGILLAERSTFRSAAYPKS